MYTVEIKERVLGTYKFETPDEAVAFLRKVEDAFSEVRTSGVTILGQDDQPVTNPEPSVGRHAEVVAKAAALLDEAAPDWYTLTAFDPSNIEKLDQHDPFKCVLAGTFGDYNRGVHALEGRFGRGKGIRSFDHDPDLSNPFAPIGEHNDEVTELWRGEIRRRRARS